MSTQLILQSSNVRHGIGSIFATHDSTERSFDLHKAIMNWNGISTTDKDARSLRDAKRLRVKVDTVFTEEDVQQIMDQVTDSHNKLLTHANCIDHTVITTTQGYVSHEIILRFAGWNQLKRIHIHLTPETKQKLIEVDTDTGYFEFEFTPAIFDEMADKDIPEEFHLLLALAINALKGQEQPSFKSVFC